MNELGPPAQDGEECAGDERAGTEFLKHKGMTHHRSRG
jgi:hypothetical protein